MDKDYDLKLEMLKEPKSIECIKDILEKTKSKLRLEELFNNSKLCQIERYLLFKAQGCLGCGFDCDKSKAATNFFRKNFNYVGEGMDTLISMQYIWGKCLKTVWGNYSNQIAFEKDSEEYKFFKEKYGTYEDYETKEIKIRIDKAQKYIYEFMKLEEIKEALGDKLYNKFCDFAHYYHTIRKYVSMS